MPLLFWVIGFAIQTLFSYWVVCAGGADSLRGWRSFFLVNWFAPNWSADGIRLYVLIAWFFSAICFLIGLFYPALYFQS
jgi:hypothetical protein